MCVSREEFWDAVRHECAEHEAKAGQYDRCRAALSEVTQYRDELHGQLEVYEELEIERLDAVRAEAVMRAELDDKWSALTWLAIVGGAALASFGAGLAVGL